MDAETHAPVGEVAPVQVRPDGGSDQPVSDPVPAVPGEAHLPEQATPGVDRPLYPHEIATAAFYYLLRQQGGYVRIPKVEVSLDPSLSMKLDPMENGDYVVSFIGQDEAEALNQAHKDAEAKAVENRKLMEQERKDLGYDENSVVSEHQELIDQKTKGIQDLAEAAMAHKLGGILGDS